MHYPPRGWRIPRNRQGEVNFNDVHPDIDAMVDDLASGWSEIEARRRWRNRIRAARHTAMRWHNWQIEQGIIPSGPIRPATGARDGDRGGAGAPSSAHPSAPPLYRSQPPAKAKSPGSKGLPLDRSQPPAKSKGTGGKGLGKGGQSAGKGGKKGAHPGRGEHSRYAGYSEATNGAAPSTKFQASVPEGQAKGAPPKGPPSTPGRTDVSSGPVSAQGYMPESISHFNPAEIEEERRMHPVSITRFSTRFSPGPGLLRNPFVHGYSG